MVASFANRRSDRCGMRARSGTAQRMGQIPRWWDAPAFLWSHAISHSRQAAGKRTIQWNEARARLTTYWVECGSPRQTWAKKTLTSDLISKTQRKKVVTQRVKQPLDPVRTGAAGTNVVLW